MEKQEPPTESTIPKNPPKSEKRADGEPWLGLEGVYMHCKKKMLLTVRQQQRTLSQKTVAPIDFVLVDEAGNRITDTKAAYRALGHKWHGTGPSKSRKKRIIKLRKAESERQKNSAIAMMTV